MQDYKRGVVRIWATLLGYWKKALFLSLNEVISMSILSRIVQYFKNKRTQESFVDTPSGKIKWDNIAYFASKPFDINGKICSSCYKGHCPR